MKILKTEEHPTIKDIDTEECRLLSGPRARGTEFWSIIRVAAEFIRGFRALHFVGPCVTVFGSARFGENNPYYELASQVGRELACAGFTVMTGGGPGIMEAANRGAREAGGRSLGCNIQLPKEQAPNAYLDKWITFDHFYVRKVMLVKYSYGFIVLPGGLGTLDEVFEVLTLVQTGKISEFPVVLMPAGFWSPIIDCLRDGLIYHGTITQADLGCLSILDSAQEAVGLIRDTALRKFGLTYRRRPLRRRFFLE